LDKKHSGIVDTTAVTPASVTVVTLASWSGDVMVNGSLGQGDYAGIVNTATGPTIATQSLCACTGAGKVGLDLAFGTGRLLYVEQSPAVPTIPAIWIAITTSARQIVFETTQGNG
jgi:hypothetical protein